MGLRHVVRATARPLALCLSSVPCLAACSVTGTSPIGEARGASTCSISDILYVGDFKHNDKSTLDNTVERFDSVSGADLGTFVTRNSGGLITPTGIAFYGDTLLVASQNASPTGVLGPFGELLLYDAGTGAFDRALVSNSNPDQSHAPYSPRGVAVSNAVVPTGAVYVADQGDFTLPTPKLGHIDVFDAVSGAFLTQFDPPTVPIPDANADTCSKLPDPTICTRLAPRDLVFGQDGMLYIAAVPPSILTSTNGKVTTENLPGGYLLRLDPSSGDFSVVYDASPPNSILNRPTSLAFDTDGRLYTMSNAGGDAPNEIVIFDVSNGQATEADTILLDAPAGELVFGPCGDLFVTFMRTSELRSYDVSSGAFVELVQKQMSPNLTIPFYLAFRGTDPATRLYEP